MLVPSQILQITHSLYFITAVQYNNRFLICILNEMGHTVPNKRTKGQRLFTKQTLRTIEAKRPSSQENVIYVEMKLLTWIN